jgi:hypothetical protein
MMSIYDFRLFHLDPQNKDPKPKEWDNIAWIELDYVTSEKPINQIAEIFSEFGDFNIFKETKNSCYLEFYYFEPTKVPSKTLEEFMKII